MPHLTGPPLQAEHRLREAVYKCAIPDRNMARGAAQCILERVQQPVEELQVRPSRTPCVQRGWHVPCIAQHLHAPPLLAHAAPRMQIPAYRLAAGLCCRSWFAADVCRHEELSALLSDPRQGSAAMCKWRFAVVLSLAKTTDAARSREAAGQQGAGVDAELAEHAAHWAEVQRAGPYGADGASQVEAVPDVAEQTG